MFHLSCGQKCTYGVLAPEIQRFYTFVRDKRYLDSKLVRLGGSL